MKTGRHELHESLDAGDEVRYVVLGGDFFGLDLAAVLIVKPADEGTFPTKLRLAILCFCG